MALGRQFRAALFAVVLTASQLGAQQPTGTLTGRVVDGVTQEPLSGAVVSVGARSAPTGADGRYTLTGVAAGPQVVRAARIGYGTSSRQVTVVGGETVTADFQLTTQALAMDELVVIGYGERRARDIAASVDAVSAENFNEGPVVNASQLIQGRVAGVQVYDSGEPGGGTTIRIRGTTSVNASNEPLIVVDGVPLPSGGGLSAGRNPLNFIDPNDVESVTILKDAAASAIYGARGANGVMIIETRSGRQADAGLTYGASFHTSRALSQPDMLDPAQFRQAVQQHAPNITQYLGSAATDWRREVQREGFGQEHTLALSGAATDLNYRFSLGYLEEEGVIRGSRMERLSGSFNYAHSLFGNRLNVSAHARGARTEDRFTPGAVLGAATVFDPTQPVRTETGFFEHTNFILGPNNPVAELEMAVVEGTTYRSIGGLEAQYRTPFLDALSGTLRLGYDVADSERRTFYPTIMRSQVESARPGFVDRSNPTEIKGILDAYANYNAPVGALSNVDATAGYSYETDRGDYPYLWAAGLTTDLLGTSGIPTADEGASTVSVSETRLASFFGRVNYTLNDRYLLTLSLRRDGSSRFGPANQWANFPAVAVGWHLGEEPFMRRLGWLSQLKLRGSWGRYGNQEFGDYQWVSSYLYGDQFSRVQFGDDFITTIRPSAVDPSIKWEETTSYNVGLDYGMFGERFRGSVEYYVKDTDDLIFRIPVAAGTNLSNFVTTNVGSMRNRGFEFSLDARVLDGGGAGPAWTARFNAATNRNRLLTVNPFGQGGERIPLGGIAGGVGNTIQVLQPGFPVRSFLVYQHKRGADGRPIYSDEDLDMYVDVNGDGAITQDDRVPFHNPAGTWTFGHTSDFAFRNLDLSVALRANVGNYVYNNVASSQGFYNALLAAGGPVNLHASVLETGFEREQYFSDYYVEDASFLRMDNVTLGYRLPRIGGARQMRLYGSVQNVFTLTGYSGLDPEAGLEGIDLTIYPRARTFQAGVSVGF